MTDQIPITRQGYEGLRKELENLKKVLRPQTIKAIEEARAHGDLSENAEYHAAKERQGFLEGRINELEYKLARAEVIDPANASREVVLFGATVRLENIETGEAAVYQLVGPDESDIAQGRISIASPLGRAILGKRLGDEIVISAPAGKRSYELIDIL